MKQNIGQVIFGDDDQAVRFLQVGPDLAEEYIGRDADRAGEAFADLVRAKACLILSASSRATGTCRSVPVSLQAISSIEETFSTGTQVSTALRMRS
jgi:hypothetical protein